MTNRQKRGADTVSSSKSRKGLDCEAGVFSVSVDTEATSGMKPKQRLQSRSYRELYLSFAEVLSYRCSTRLLNRALHRADSHRISASTLEDRVESQGNALSSVYDSLTGSILKSNNISPETGIVTADATIPYSARHPELPAEVDETCARRLITEFNHGKDSSAKLKYGDIVSPIESSADNCCYVSIDDVGVRFQKDKRGDTYRKKRTFIENTVIHVQCGDSQYTITATGMAKAFKRLVAFLLANGLMENRRLVFLTDGAACIRDYIIKFFGFRQYTIILDWLHLKKKCMEYLSMTIKGTKAEKNRIKKGLAAALWTGRADKVYEYLRDIKGSNIKNYAKMEELKGYISRKRPHMACYALRKQLGLRISSNRVEKANDMVVAARQKHNGMAWSEKGSGALAIITAARINGELQDWINGNTPRFKMAA